MNRTLALAIAFWSGASLAADIAPRSAVVDSGLSLRGFYGGIAAGAQVMYFGWASGPGYDFEARAGYSFGPEWQLYLSGVFDGSQFGTTPAASVNTQFVTSAQIAVFLQHHFVVRPAVMVYARGGLGVAISSSYAPADGFGFGGAGGVGVEIRLGKRVFFAPELLFRLSSLSAQGYSDSYHLFGIQLGLVYY